MKSLLILFSILAAIPIILYPLAWALSITIFDAPNSTQVPWKHLLYYAVLGYPIFIIICIIFAWKFDSIIWAIIGMIPLFCFIPILLPDSAFKERFNNTQKDYICNQETYLNVHVPGNF